MLPASACTYTSWCIPVVQGNGAWQIQAAHSTRGCHQASTISNGALLHEGELVLEHTPLSGSIPINASQADINVTHSGPLGRACTGPGRFNPHVDHSAVAVDKLVPLEVQLGRRPAPGWLVWGAGKHACYV
jgi:hypothetical protein